MDDKQSSSYWLVCYQYYARPKIRSQVCKATLYTKRTASTTCSGKTALLKQRLRTLKASDQGLSPLSAIVTRPDQSRQQELCQRLPYLAMERFQRSLRRQRTSRSSSQANWTPCPHLLLLLLCTLIGEIRTSPIYAQEVSSSPTSTSYKTEVVSSAHYVANSEYHFNSESFKIGDINMQANYVLHTVGLGYKTRGSIMSSYECPPVRRKLNDPISEWKAWSREERTSLETNEHAAVKCVTACNGWNMSPICMADCGTEHCAVLHFPKEEEKIRVYQLRSGMVTTNITTRQTTYTSEALPATIGDITISIDNDRVYPMYIVTYGRSVHALSRESGDLYLSSIPVYKRPYDTMWSYRNTDVEYDTPHHKWYAKIDHPHIPGSIVRHSPVSNDTHYWYSQNIIPHYVTFTAPIGVIRERTGRECRITTCRDAQPGDEAPIEVTTTGVYVMYIEVDGDDCLVTTADGGMLHVDRKAIFSANSNVVTSKNSRHCEATVTDDRHVHNFWSTHGKEGKGTNISIDTQPLARMWKSTLSFIGKLGSHIFPVVFACLLVYVTKGALWPTIIAALIIGAIFVTGAEAAPLDHHQLVAEYTCTIAFTTMDYLEIPSRSLLVLAILSAALLGPMREVSDVAESFTIILIGISKHSYYIKLPLILALFMGSFRRSYKPYLVKAFKASADAAHELRSLNTIPLNELAHLYKDSGKRSIPAEFIGRQTLITKPRPRRRKPYSPLQSRCNRRRLISALFYTEEIPILKKHLDSLSTSDLIVLQHVGLGVHARSPGKIEELFQHVQDPPDWVRDISLV
nr:ORF1 [Ailanthus flavi-like virus]